MSGQTYKAGQPWLVTWQYFTSESVKHRSQPERCCFNRDAEHVLLVYYLELEMVPHAYGVEVKVHCIDIHFLEIVKCDVGCCLVCMCVLLFVLSIADFIPCTCYKMYLTPLFSICPRIIYMQIILRMRLRSNVKVIPLGRSGELLFHLCHYVLLENFVESWLLSIWVVRLWYSDIWVGFNKVVVDLFYMVYYFWKLFVMLVLLWRSL